MAQLLFLLAAVAFAAAAPTSDDGNLWVLSRSPTRLQALYRRGANTGLVVTSEVNGPYNHKTSISNFDGLQLVSVQSTDSAVLWKVMGQSYLLHRNRANVMQEYVVQPAMTQHVEKAMEQGEYRPRLFRYLDTASTEATKLSAFTQLFSRPEMATIFEMSQALGDDGVNGYDNQAALNFHGLALNFAKIQSRGGFGSTAETHKSVGIIQKEACSTVKKGWMGGALFAKDYNEECDKCPLQPYCVGMCGPKCVCWPQVCGNCCLHHGCYMHDMCCVKYTDFRCLMVFPIKCTHYRYDCEKIDKNPFKDY